MQLHSGHFFVFITAINLVFLYHTMLFHENIIEAYFFTIFSKENKTNCACVHHSGNSAKDFRLGIHKNKFETTSFSLSNSSCRCVVKLANRMPWSASQQKRLGLEKELLDKYFPNRVKWIDPGSGTKVEVQVTCSNDRQYTLRVYIPEDFPNSCPKMVVKSAMLRAYNGVYLHQYPGDNHTGYNIDGYSGICHFRPNLWRANNTLYQVFMKGLIWLEAFQSHLRTGQPLSKYLSEMNG